jgi:hypothetical protein
LGEIEFAFREMVFNDSIPIFGNFVLVRNLKF